MPATSRRNTTLQTLSERCRRARRQHARTVRAVQRVAPLTKTDKPTMIMWGLSIYLGIMMLPALALPVGTAPSWTLIVLVHVAISPFVLAFIHWFRGVREEHTALHLAAWARLEALRGALGDDHEIKVHDEGNGVTTLSIPLAAGTLKATISDAATPARMAWTPRGRSPDKKAENIERVRARLHRAATEHRFPWRLEVNQRLEGGKRLTWTVSLPAWLSQTPEASATLMTAALGWVDPTLDLFEGHDAERRFPLSHPEVRPATRLRPSWLIATGAVAALLAVLIGTHLGLLNFGNKLDLGRSPILQPSFRDLDTVLTVILALALVPLAISLWNASREAIGHMRARVSRSLPWLVADGHGLRVEGTGEPASIDWGRPFGANLWRSGDKVTDEGMIHVALDLRQGDQRILVGAVLHETTSPQEAQHLEVETHPMSAGAFLELLDIVHRAQALS